MTLSRRLLIGLGVPVGCVLLTILLPAIPPLAVMRAAAFGVPVAVLWLFGCIPLTSACLALCWRHDRHEAEPGDGGPPAPPTAP